MMGAGQRGRAAVMRAPWRLACVAGLASAESPEIATCLRTRCDVAPVASHWRRDCLLTAIPWAASSATVDCCFSACVARWLDRFELAGVDGADEGGDVVGS